MKSNTTKPAVMTPDILPYLEELERKVLWLSSWMVHHANHERENRSGIKVGGHQASCASVATLLTALYFHVLRPQDRVAIKPHASPVFHAIQYLLGIQSREQLQRFRSLGGAQAYPSRTKDSDDVDISTGSVGLGVALTTFLSLTQDYLMLKNLLPSDQSTGRMVALVGDAELDEGNVYEALFEGWKHDVRNLWWVIDYNRHSLDGTISDQLFEPVMKMFHSMGWRVELIKYGKLQQRAFRQKDGPALREWINACPNSRYSRLTFSGGAAWRDQLEADLGSLQGIQKILKTHDDDALHRLMTNLAGHDMACVLEAFAAVHDDRPTCFVAYTIKGKGLPFEGHKDNHSGLMTRAQMASFQHMLGIPQGEEWEPFSGLNIPAAKLSKFLKQNPFAQQRGQRSRQAAAVELPERDALMPNVQGGEPMSTQEGFGRVLHQLANSETELAARIVTTSPDVTVSTNLGGWVNQRQIFQRQEHQDEAVSSMHHWHMSPAGQHLELGIAENNLFIALAGLGLSAPLFGTRLLPIGTLYDPFVRRGLDAFHYACYSDARFMLVGTPSGITLAPEGGAHQSSMTPLIGIGQPGLLSFEPTYVDELAVIMHWSFAHMQQPDGCAIYLRLSTRPIAQPERVLDDQLRAHVLSGAYWHTPPEAGASLALLASGPLLPEAIEALEQIKEDVPGAGLMVVTSADILYRDWFAARNHGQGATQTSHVERLLGQLDPHAALVSVLDGHPLALSWLASVNRQHLTPLGVMQFGQSGDVHDLYRHYRVDAEAIMEAAATATLRRLRAS